MPSNLVLFTLSITAFLVAGCVNNHQKFYVDKRAHLSTTVQTKIIPYAGDPEIVVGSGNPNNDINGMREAGYALLGYSSFNAADGGGKEELIAQAKRVGAAKVIHYQKYTSTESGVTPITLPDVQTTYHSGSASAYGSSGTSVYGNYSGTSTSYGSKTTYIPYSKDRFDYQATFWAKLRSMILGVYVRRPNADEQAQAETTRGLLIRSVSQGSPAEDVGLVPGDLILKFNMKPIDTPQSFLRSVELLKGTEVRLEILRKGRKIVKTAQFGK